LSETIKKEKFVPIKNDIPKVENIPLKDKMYKFSGQWLPSVDPILIGADNFQELINMRYCESGIEGVNGYFDFNSTAIEDYVNINSGLHFRTNRTGDSYILVHASDSSGNGRIYYSTSEVGCDEGLGHFKIDFDSESNKIVDDFGKDAKEFSDFTGVRCTATQNETTAPDGTNTGAKITEDGSADATHYIYIEGALDNDTVYTTSIFLKKGTRSAVNLRLSEATPFVDLVEVSVDLENGVLGTPVASNDATLTGATITAYSDDWYLVTITGDLGTLAGGNCRLWCFVEYPFEDQTYDGDGSSYIYAWGAKITESTSYEHAPKVLHSDTSADLVGRLSNGPSGVVAYCNQEESLIWEGTEADIMAIFTCATNDPDEAPAFPIDFTEEAKNRIVSEYMPIDTTAGRSFGIVLSTAPLQGIKLYVDPANANDNAAGTDTIVVKYWNGSALAAVGNLVDGTSKLTVTGTLAFDSTISTAKAKHFKERYAYAYTWEVTTTSGECSANIYQVTVDKPMQAPTNIWDGIYRQPIQAQRYKDANTSYEDFTVHVREPSVVDLPVGLYVGQLAAADHIILMFDDRMAAIKFTMLGSLVNVANAQFDATDGIQYWDGDSWANLSYTDQTLDAAKDSSCSKTGLMYWTPPTDEEQTELFGTLGYAYKLSVDDTFTGAADDEVTIDLVTGIPAQEDIKKYKFPAQYKNKLMMCGYVEGNEGNRIDFSVDNNPHMFNGLDSSDNGYQSIYVGSVEEITAATQLYNRFGSNILSMFVILKNNEVWLMVGDTPVDYKLFPISFGIGCPAPGTLCTAEVGFKIGEDVERNVAMWVSHQGPVMFDGAIIHPIKGIETFFDPNETNSINFDYFNTSQAWFDSTKNEWNILIPIATSTSLNKWLVYDVRRQKWFEKDTNVGTPITCGIQSIATTGDQYIYGGAADGRIYELETGASWNGSDITYSVKVGDVFPTGNQWDKTLLRRLKLVTKLLSESGASLDLYYSGDTSSGGGLTADFTDVTANISYNGNAGGAFVDVTSSVSNTSTEGVSFVSAPADTLDMSVGEGLNRTVRITKDMNQISWCHSFRFAFTSSSSNKGFQPLMWGMQSQNIRIDQ